MPAAVLAADCPEMFSAPSSRGLRLPGLLPPRLLSDHRGFGIGRDTAGRGTHARLERASVRWPGKGKDAVSRDGCSRVTVCAVSAEASKIPFHEGCDGGRGAPAWAGIGDCCRGTAWASEAVTIECCSERSTPRGVPAGAPSRGAAPVAADILKCSLKPVDVERYAGLRQARGEAEGARRHLARLHRGRPVAWPRGWARSGSEAIDGPASTRDDLDGGRPPPCAIVGARSP